MRIRPKTYFSICVVLFMLLASHKTLSQVDVNVMKAVAFEQISRFIQWPDQDMTSKNSGRFIIGVLGHNTVVEHIEELYAKQKIKDKAVELRHISNLDDVIGCHLLYIAGTKRDELSKVMAITRKRPILSISDSSGFIEKGVLVNLYVSMNKLRFEINEQGFLEAGLTIDPLLLKVARIVNPPGGDR